jgi:hypothetical protein
MQSIYPMDAYRLSDLGNFMDGYYLNPRPELISDAILLLGGLEVRKNSIPPYVGFFNRVFNDNDKYRSQWNQQIEMQNEIVRKILSFSMKTKPSVILSKMKVSAAFNDFCWGSYFASGDDRYLEILLDNTKYCSETDDINLFFTGWTAKWSLCSNAKGYKKVRYFLSSKLSVSKDVNIEQILSQEAVEIKDEMFKKVKENKQSGVWDDKSMKMFSDGTGREVENIFLIQ